VLEKREANYGGCKALRNAGGLGTKKKDARFFGLERFKPVLSGVD
jgi:hypothetical protein